MALTNVEVVADQYAAVNERDFERAMGHYAEDVELIGPPGGLLGGHFHGIETVGAWFGDWFRTFGDDARFDLDEITELPGGAVLVVASHAASGRASGVAVRGELIWLYHLRDGRVVHVWGHTSREDALRAAEQGIPRD